MKYYNYIIFIFIALGMASCTKDFLEINTDPNAITQDEASARYFITDPQYKLYGPDRWFYWRAHLIHADRYAGHFTFGFNGSWWSDELGYSYQSAYTDASWDWMAGYFGSIDNFLGLTEPGGDFENDRMHAVGMIIQGLYYQMYTDLFGEIPFSEAGVEGIVTPKYDTQLEIYTGIIEDLDNAMSTIGDNAKTGEGIDDLGVNDLYFGGDLQLWKKLANSLKLRIALRAYGAEGATFADAAITEALNAGLFLAEGEDCIMVKDDIISQWESGAYGDIWYGFGGLGSKWNVGQNVIDNLRNNNDPRLPFYAEPADGGVVDLVRPAADPGRSQFPKHVDFVTQVLTDAGVAYTRTDVGADLVTIDMPVAAYYVGQPTRMGGDIYSYIRPEFFSRPAPEIFAEKNSGTNMWDEIILTAAEAYFLQAEAALLGFGGDAQALYQSGISNAMSLWGVSDGDITTFIGAEDMALLNGTTEQNMEKVSIQRWLACYTDGFEAWAIARKSGYPSNLTTTLTDPEIYGLGSINGLYPERMRYGSNVQTMDPDNYQIVIGRQGPDRQDTKLWWAK